MNQADLIWSIISLILTLMIFSYVIGDNFLFRIATYIFVGVSSAYVAVLLIQNIIIPKLFFPLLSGKISSIIFAAIPLLLSLLLFFKLFPRFNRFGNIPLAIIVGTGTGVILTGSILGTLIPQTSAVIKTPDQTSNWLMILILIIGTISTLFYFQFSTFGKPRLENGKGGFTTIIKQIGSGFIGLSLGAIFAGIILSAIIALISRLNFIMQVFSSIING